MVVLGELRAIAQCVRHCTPCSFNANQYLLLFSLNGVRRYVRRVRESFFQQTSNIRNARKLTIHPDDVVFGRMEGKYYMKYLIKLIENDSLHSCFRSAHTI